MTSRQSCDSSSPSSNSTIVALIRLAWIAVKEVIGHPGRVAYYWSQARLVRRSGAGLSRFAAFRTTLSLWWHAVAYPDPKAPRRHRIANWLVWGYGFAGLRVLFREIYVEGHYAIQLKRSRPVIIDCGANIGMSVLFFKLLYPQARIYAFEPNPKAFALLKRNVEENRLKDVVLYNRALVGSERNAELFVNDDPGSLHASLNSRRSGGEPIAVSGFCLSRLIKEIGTIDLVKIDTEGAEVEIVRDLERSGCLGRVAQYVVEYHHDTARESGAFPELLAAFARAGFAFAFDTSLPRSEAHQDVMMRMTRMASYSADQEHFLLPSAALISPSLN